LHIPLLPIIDFPIVDLSFNGYAAMSIIRWVLVLGNIILTSAVGSSAQARDTALLGEEENADSNLRKSDY
jgi:hypothetical protein